MFYQVDREKKHFKLSKGKEEGKGIDVFIEQVRNGCKVRYRVQGRQGVTVTPAWDTQVPGPLLSMTVTMGVKARPRPKQVHRSPHFLRGLKGRPSKYYHHLASCPGPVPQHSKETSLRSLGGGQAQPFTSRIGKQKPPGAW